MPGLTGQRLLIMVVIVQPLSRATNAEAVVAAGIQKLNMSPIQNTNVRTRRKFADAPLVRAPSTKIYKLHEAWAVAHGYRTKVQAPSAKRQAPSSKLKNIIESFLDSGPRISNQEA